MRKSIFTLAAAFSLVACSALAVKAADHHVPAELHGVHRIVTLGDSITQGGAHPGGYVWLINEYLQVLYPEHKFEVINAGISGHKSNDMLDRYQRDVLDHHPDLVTISVGINDVWHGFTPEHPAGYGSRRIPLDVYRANVEKMIEMAEHAGVKVELFTTTIFEDEPNSIRNLRVAGYDDAMRELAAKHHTLLADQYAAFMSAWDHNRHEGKGVRLTGDQVHMAPAGDELMARTALLGMGISPRALDRAHDEVMRRAGAH